MSEPITYDATPVIEQPKPVVDVVCDNSLPDTDLLAFAQEIGQITQGNDVTDFLTDEPTKQKVSFIVDWLSKTTTDRKLQALEYQKLKNQLGRPPVGKTTLQHIYQYIYLLSKSQELNKEIQNYGR